MTPVQFAAQLACLDIYDPITPNIFDNVYRVGESCWATKLVGNRLHVVCQGTESLAGWMADADVIPYLHPKLGHLHSGFWENIEALVYSHIAPLYSELWKTCNGLEIEFSGHSKGAGEAIIAAAEMKRFGFNVVQVILFACPNAGFQDFTDWLAHASMNCISYRNAPDGPDCLLVGDPVPLVPSSPYVAPVSHTHICSKPPGFEQLLSVEWHHADLYFQAMAALG